MGRVRDEVAPHLLLPLQRGGHLVERIGEAGELFGAVARHPGGVVAVGDPPGGRTDLAQWSRQHPSEDDRETDARQDRDERRGDDDGRDRSVVHLARVLGRIPGLHHQRGEHVGPDHGDPDGEDHQSDGRAGDRSQRDPGGDPAREHDYVLAARYPTPRTVWT